MSRRLAAYNATRDYVNQVRSRRNEVAPPVERNIHDTRTRLDSRWLKDTNLKDVTIVFGPKDEDRFKAHRLVLCNSIEWFNRTSTSFKEANSSEITLHNDDPDAVRSMLTWAYDNKYEDGLDHGTMSLARAKELFLQHLRVFVVADKYFAKGLERRALACLEKTVEYYINGKFVVRLPSEASSFMRFAVEEVFVYQTCFHFSNGTQHDVTPSLTTAHGADFEDDDDATTDTLKYPPESDEDFFQDPSEGKEDHNPIDQVQTFLARLCVKVCGKKHNPEFNVSHLQTFVAKVEGFAQVLAHEMLE